MVWKDKCDVHILANMHRSSAEEKFCEEHLRVQKPDSSKDYSRHMVYVNKGDRMTNSYSVIWRT